MNDTLALVNARIDEWLADHPRTVMAKGTGIRIDTEFERINSLRRRTWTDQEAEDCAKQMTAILRQSTGEQTLRPIQAIALYEFAEHRGLMASIRVGGGKTLITLLGPTVIGSRKPLLILPAKLIPKTRRAMIALCRHWRIALHTHIVSYEWLGTQQAAQFFYQTEPDLIMLDEAHKVRNRKAARTRRLIRYCEKRNPAVMVLSGTIVRKRLLDWAPLAACALGPRSPAPRKWTTIQHWGSAIDFDATTAPGVLSRWAESGGFPSELRERAREGYRRRVVETPGVVATSDQLLGVALNVEPWETPLAPELLRALKTLEDSWTLPDGFIVTDPLHYWRASRQLALGCYYRWKEQPPNEWRERRLNWSRAVRHAVRYLRQPGGQPFDSEAQVAGAALRGEIKSTDTIDVTATYLAWREIRDTFKPETEHVWVTHDIVMRLIEESFNGDPAIVWVETVAVGELMHALGYPYYGKQGRTPDRKRSILDAPPSQPFAASIRSVGEGHDLQAWNRNLVSAPIQAADQWEQLLGRTHRDGQAADEVTVQVAMYTSIHQACWRTAIDHARFLQSMTGQEQKLLIATMGEGMPDNE